ncbi:MAG: hypothetical protein LBV12_11720 [Puniceicoccales bacterium]|jgi:hypothetical protein|nr:hypothetical protein [Puniceicoccales bacterium]
MVDDTGNQLRTLKKLTYPLRGRLREYLAREGREVKLPVSYAQLTGFVASAPLLNKDGSDSMWEIVAYPPHEMEHLNAGLTETYALLRGEGETSFFRHLYVDRIDYCAFGNSKPFRIRIVNAYNENPDYFYFKIADASRVYGLELEHLLSPNRMHYLTDRDTLVEEHIVGIPGDVFITDWLNSEKFPPVRLAKEMIKFNERCLIRLLGDMRAYNFVIAVTPDFDTAQIRVRAMDFDQQSYNGRVKFYIPQYFKDNNPYVFHCMKYVNEASSIQYQKEEQSLIYRRAIISADLLRDLLAAMREHPISPEEKALQLAGELADFYKDNTFSSATNMADLLKISLERLHGSLREAGVSNIGMAHLSSPEGVSF